MFRELRTKKKLHKEADLKKKELFIFFILVTISSLVFTSETVPLPDILKPAKIEVGDEQIYIVEDAKIYVYDLKNLKLKTKFGKKGEGPGEFPVGRHFSINLVNVFPQKDKVVVNSRNKIMFFTKDGQFLSEKKIKGTFGSRILPFGKKYIGTQFSDFRERNPTLAINIYDENLKKLKEIARIPVNFGGMMGRSNSKINEFSSVFGYSTGNDKIYLFHSQDFIVDVINLKGEKETPIKVDYKQIKMSSGLKTKIMNYYKEVRYKNMWDRVKSRIELPDTLPAIQTIQVKDNQIYVQTYKKDNGKCEFYVFNQNHKLIKVVMLPLKEINIREYFPFCIKSSKLYQVAEDEDQEECVLLINDI